MFGSNISSRSDSTILQKSQLVLVRIDVIFMRFYFVLFVAEE